MHDLRVLGCYRLVIWCNTHASPCNVCCCCCCCCCPTLKVLERSGITYVSVGHRPTLRKHHRQLLEVLPAPLDGSSAGTWSVKSLVGATAGV